MLLTVAEVEGQTVKHNGRSYTHVGEGMLWRFDGSRPVSQLADEVMDECIRKIDGGSERPARDPG